MEMIRIEVLAALAALLLLTCPIAAGAAKGPLVVEPEGKAGQSVAFWLQSSLARVYPTSDPASGEQLDLIAGRGGRISFQACLRNNRTAPLGVECSVTGADGLQVQVRRVGFVPMQHFTTDTRPQELEGIGHVPGLVPDPLFPESKATVGPLETGAFWITITVPADAKPGVRDLNVRFSFLNDKQADLSTKLKVSSFVIKPRHDFPVTHWWRQECIWDYYKTGMFEDEKLWEITKPFIKDMVDHGSETIYVPIFFNRRETFKRPAQLLKVTEPEPGKYVFDWSDVSRFVKLAKDCGAQHYEWSHLWIYWGVENPIRVYKWVDGKAVMLWPPDTDGHGELYHSFLKQFLPQFHDFLVSEGILDKSFFHLSDEPGGGQHLINYKKAKTFLREVAPWMKVMDALSDVEYGKQGLTDMPIPLVTTAPQFLEAGIPHWVYFCCAPHGDYLNRFYDTPLAKIRMSGWCFYKMQAKGFLHWGYNYWHAIEQEKMADPFVDGCCAAWPSIPYGDGHMVYPGPNGPIDSIRWEVFSESLQDYAILQTAGIKPSDPMLSDIKDYASFPKNEEWIEKRLREILKK